MDIAQLLEHMGVIDGRAPRGEGDVTPAFQRREQHEQIGGAITLVFVIVAGRAPWRHGQGGTGFGGELLGGLVETNQRPIGIMGTGVEGQNIFHRGDEGRVRFGRNDPVFAQMRFEMVFLSARPTVLKWACSTIFNSTTLSASRRMLQRACPGGGSEQASAVSRAWASPSKIG